MKIFLDTIGCRLNQAEIESMARQFRAAGHEIVASAETADMAVVNTCAVTTQAASDSRSKIRNIARAGVEQIIPTGCWTTLQPKEAAALPNVLRVVTNDQKDSLVPTALNLEPSAFDLEPIDQYLPIFVGDGARDRVFRKKRCPDPGIEQVLELYQIPFLNDPDGCRSSRPAHLFL